LNVRRWRFGLGIGDDITWRHFDVGFGQLKSLYKCQRNVLQARAVGSSAPKLVFQESQMNVDVEKGAQTKI
jgi:hypothetical protein